MSFRPRWTMAGLLAGQPVLITKLIRAARPNGQGTYSFPGGAKYIGEIKDGFYDGQGTYTSAEGWTQSGLWDRGKFVGANSGPIGDSHQY